MEWTPGSLVIDARPRGPRGPLATELVRGRSLLDRVLDLAIVLFRNSQEPIAVVVRFDDEPLLRPSIEGHPSGRFVIASRLPPGAAVLRTDRLYDLRALRETIRGAGDPESAALWRIDGPHGLAGANEILQRTRGASPLGRYWALRPARRLARSLAPTLVHPNVVTTAASACLLGAAALVALTTPTIVVRGATATLLALALILNRTDGHLAKLQRTDSSFGRWLAGWLDAVGDMTLHAAIAWSAFQASSSPLWLALGMLYGMGRYVFAYGSDDAPGMGSIRSTIVRPPGSRLTRWIRLAGHRDMRWHLWIALAALGRLEWALAGFAAYYPARAVSHAVERVVRRA